MTGEGSRVTPQVHGTGGLHHRPHRRAQLDGVGGGDRHHAGHGAEDGDVLHALVRLAGLAGEDAGVAAAHLDVEVRLGNDDAHLIRGAVGHEGGEGREPGHEAEGGHARPPRRPCSARRCPSRRSGRAPPPQRCRRGWNWRDRRQARSAPDSRRPARPASLPTPRAGPFARRRPGAAAPPTASSRCS